MPIAVFDVDATLTDTMDVDLECYERAIQSETPTLPLDKIEGPWKDEVIELRTIQVLQPGDISERSPETEFLAKVPEVRFAIHRLSDGLRVGRIHLRVTDDPTILEILGHGGYEPPTTCRLSRQRVIETLIRALMSMRNGLSSRALRNQEGEARKEC